MKINKYYIKLSLLIIFVIYAAALFHTIDDYGYFWDEPPNIDLSLEYKRFFADVLKDISNLTKKNISSVFDRDMTITSHPPLTHFLGLTAELLFKKWIPYSFSFRLVSVFLSLLLLAVLVVIVMKRYDHFSALFLMVIYIVSPRLFAFSNSFSIVIPFTLFYFITIFTANYAFDTGKKMPVFLAAVFLGLSHLTYIGSLIILPVIFLILLCNFSKKNLFRFIIIIIGSLVIFYAGWPKLWFSPLSEFLEYMKYFFKHSAVNVKYLSNIYKDGAVPPFHYSVIMFCVTIPLSVLLFFIVSFFYAKKDFKFNRLLLLSVFVPVILFSLPGRVKYDGTRLFFFVYPFILLTAVSGFYYLLKKKTIIKIILILIILSAGMRNLVFYHPYQLSYYNLLTGGLKGAAKLGFEETYWAEPVNEEVLSYLNENIPSGKNVLFYPFSPLIIKKYIDEKRLRVKIDYESKPDYIVIYSREAYFDRNISHIYKKMKPVKSFQCDGVQLVGVYKL